jgi:hypothetical protein
MRVVTASEDGTARISAIGRSRLQAILRNATRACLEPTLRMSYLDEPEGEAKETYERCLSCTASWRSRFDDRSVRAAPDEAWSKWQKCMGR